MTKKYITRIKISEEDLQTQFNNLKTIIDYKAASSHTQAASTIRNIKANTTDLTAGTSELANGDIYFVYE